MLDFSNGRWIVVALHAPRVFAAEDPRAFLNALRDKGYGDTALQYLELLEKQQKVPPELQETMELEKSDCYRVAAKHAYSPRATQKLLALQKATWRSLLKQTQTIRLGHMRF